MLTELQRHQAIMEQMAQGETVLVRALEEAEAYFASLGLDAWEVTVLAIHRELGKLREELGHYSLPPTEVNKVV